MKISKVKLFKKVTSLFLIAMFGTLYLTSCNSSGNKDSSKKKIAIICTAAGQNDNGYNQSAIEGAKKAASEFDFEYKVVEPTNGVPNALETLSEEGYNIIFNLEYDFDALIKGVGGSKPIAELYPDITYVVFNDNPNVTDDGSVKHKNVISVLFDVHEASYLAGALSVAVNENANVLFGDTYKFSSLDENGRTIGFVGGTNSNGITVFSYGYIEGINYAAKELNVKYNYYSKYDAGFADPALGSTIAGTFYNEGANIVYSVAGSVGDGVTSKAKEASKLAIQVDANKDNQQPGYVLTSVLKNTEVPVYAISKALYEDKIKSLDNLETYSLKTGATGITDLEVISSYIKDDENAKAKWEEIVKYIEEVSSKIENGDIKVINAVLGEEFDKTKYENVNIK